MISCEDHEHDQWQNHPPRRALNERSRDEHEFARDERHDIRDLLDAVYIPRPPAQLENTSGVSRVDGSIRASRYLIKWAMQRLLVKWRCYAKLGTERRTAATS